MNKIKKLFHALLHDRRKIKLVLLYKFSRFYSDEKFLKKLFRLRMGKELNLDNPKTFCEKLQWLKLYNRKPEYTQMVDKFEAKKYVANIIGEEYIIPTLGVWDRVEDIDWEGLPNQFVLKCTHDSGGLVICKDKSALDIKKAVKKLKKSMKRDYFYDNREWPYKNVKKRIIAEVLLAEDKTPNNPNGDLIDYKFFCFNGEAKVLLIATDRHLESGVRFDYFDRYFNHYPFEQGGPNSEKQIKRPEYLNEMLEIADKLSKGLPHVRVDLYCINGRIYFGELTFFDSSGMAEFKPNEWDYTFGSWITLPRH